jgi:hypothetical protein
MGLDRKSKLVLTLMIILFNVGLVGLYRWRVNEDNPPKSDSVLKELDATLQSMSSDKPFAYKLISLNHSDYSPPESGVWCAVIDPALKKTTPDSNSSSPLINHFVLTQSPYSTWVIQSFDGTKDELESWSKMGCGGW